MKRIALIATGGTISTRDPDGRGARPLLHPADLLRDVPGLDQAAVEPEEFDFIPGSSMTPEKMAALSRRVSETLPRSEVDGAVITHGTDTVEETAYLLHLTVGSEKPVVVTGAMRNVSQVGFDGYRNLYDAVRTAAAHDLRECCVECGDDGRAEHRRERVSALCCCRGSQPSVSARSYHSVLG